MGKGIVGSISNELWSPNIAGGLDPRGHLSRRERSTTAILVRCLQAGDDDDDGFIV